MYGGVFRFYGFFGAPGKVAKRFLKFCKVFLGPLVRWQKYFKTFFGMPGYLPDMGFLILRIFLVHVGAMHPHTLIFLIQYDTVFGQLQEKEKGVLRILAVLMWPPQAPCLPGSQRVGSHKSDQSTHSSMQVLWPKVKHPINPQCG